MFFEKFRDKVEERNGTVSRGGGGGGRRFGIGMIVEFLKAEGKTPVDIERLNMWARGTEIEWAVALIKMDGILSGPGDVLRGREEMRSITVSSEQR